MRNYVELPNHGGKLTVGSKVKLNRFSDDIWIVNYGWYAWGGNRQVLGWYLHNDCGQIKPLQEPDLHDIYFMESGEKCDPELNDILYRLSALEQIKQDRLIAGDGIDISKDNVVQTTFFPISEYSQLGGKPAINGVTLQGNLTSDDLNIKVKLTADDVTFNDGMTFQQKYDSGELKGRQGDPGTPPHIGSNGNWFVGQTDTGQFAQGYTPVKGLDYFTDEDIQTIVGSVVKALPVYKGEVSSK